MMLRLVRRKNVITGEVHEVIQQAFNIRKEGVLVKTIWENLPVVEEEVGQENSEYRCPACGF